MSWLKDMAGVNIYKYDNNSINLPEDTMGFPSLFLQFYIRVNGVNYPISGREW